MQRCNSCGYMLVVLLLATRPVMLQSIAQAPIMQTTCHFKHAAQLLQYHRRCTSHSCRTSLRSASAASPAGSSAREGLLLDASIGPGLQLMEQQFNICGHILHMIAPADVDAVMDMYISRGVDGDPYWCRVWPSAVSLAQQLLQRPHLVAGKTVADLGAGLGVAGIAAALAGAKEVVLLDREPLALQCGLISAAASGIRGVQGLEDIQIQQGLGSNNSNHNSSSSSGGGSSGDSGMQSGSEQSVATAGLLQMAELYLQHRIQQQQQQQTADAQQVATGSSSIAKPLRLPLQQHSPQPCDTGVLKSRTFDWSCTEVAQRYDVILACDVLYEDTAVEPVASVVRRLLKAKPGSMLLLADPPNRTAANRQRFVELLSARSSKDVSLLLEESGVYQCDVNQLDPEMTGGVTTQSMPVQFMAFRAAVGQDTIGVKLM